MRAKDIIKFYIKVGAVWTEYSDGILNINIERGMNEYTGPQDLPDAGLLRLTSRSYDLDPYVNSNVRIGKDVKVEANGTPIFTGKLIDVNVEYRPKGEGPIVTLNATDIVGTMQQHVLRDTFKSRLGPSWMNLFDFDQELTICGTPNQSYTEIINWDATNYGINLGYGDGYVSPPAGTTAWDFYKRVLNGNLSFAYADANNNIYTYADYPLLGASHPRNNAPVMSFDSTGGSYNYFDVKLDDGFDNLCNRIFLYNFTPSVTYPLVVNNKSQIDWGTANKQFGVAIDIDDQNSYNAAIQNRIFKETVVPVRDIEALTWNAKFDPDVAKNVDIMDNIDIHHEIDTFAIQKTYGIVGIKHEIDANDWYVTYYLRNWFIYEEIIGDVAIAFNPPTGDTTTTFNFTINNANLSAISTVQWDWNNDGAWDASGINATYNWTTIGNKTVKARITDIYGLTTILTTTVPVTGPLPTSTFTWQVNSSDSSLIEFTYTGANATSFSWNFGDGSPLVTGKRVIGHKYATAGNKSVSLTTSNAYGSSTTTNTISVTPGTVTNQTGDRAVRYLMFDVPNETATAPVDWYPLMSKLKALTSNTATNRAASGVIDAAVFVGVSPWLNSSNATVNPTTPPADLLTTSAATNYGLRPTYLNGSYQRGFKLIVDLGAPYYDIDIIKLTHGFPAADFDYNNMDVYAAEDAYATWSYGGGYSGMTKIGTINPTILGEVTMTTSAGISLPLNW